LKTENIIVHIEQNHASPSIGHNFIRDECPLMPREYPWLRGGDDRYNEPAVAGMIEAVAQAAANMRPVTLQAGRGVDGRLPSTAASSCAMVPAGAIPATAIRCPSH